MKFTRTEEGQKLVAQLQRYAAIFEQREAEARPAALIYREMARSLKCFMTNLVYQLEHEWIERETVDYLLIELEVPDEPNSPLPPQSSSAGATLPSEPSCSVLERLPQPVQEHRASETRKKAIHRHRRTGDGSRQPSGRGRTGEAS